MHFLAALLAFLLITPAYASEVKLVAQVNRDVITSQDVEDRIRFTLAMTGMKPDEKTAERLRKQIIQKLIDETLQRQEAKKQGITLTEKEKEGGFAIMAKSQNKPEEELMAWLKNNGINRDIPLKQIESEMAWTKYLMSRVQPRLQISDGEVEEAVEIISNERGFSEWRVGEIFIPSSQDPSQNLEAQNLEAMAEDIQKQLKEGAEFAKLAKEFLPAGVTLEEDGTRWISPSQLDPDMAKAISGMEDGQTSSPVRTAAGVHILKLFEKRHMLEADPSDTEVAIRQVILPVPKDGNKKDVAKQMKRGQEVAAAGNGCDALSAAAGKIAGADVHDLGRMQVRDLEANVRKLITPLATGVASEPFITPLGVHVVMVCERIEARSTTIDRKRIREMIGQKKLGLEALRIMRNLRREAFIEIKN